MGCDNHFGVFLLLNVHRLAVVTKENKAAPQSDLAQSQSVGAYFLVFSKKYGIFEVCLKPRIVLRKVYNVALILILVSTFMSASAQDFKTDFYAAHDLLEQEEYDQALEAFLKLNKEHPGNSNVESIIGYCYLQSKYEKAKAIDYLIDCQDNLTAYYKVRNHKEKSAPVEAIWHLAKAYHANYQFDSALTKYQLYRSVLGEGNTEALKEINRDIRVSRNAKQLVENPVNAKLHQLANGINTEFPDYRPIITADERLLLFTSRRENSVGGKTDDEDGVYREDVYVSYKDPATGVWGEPEPIEELNNEGHEACIYIAPNGERMFLYKYDDEQGGTIYESKLIGDTWEEPKALDAAINSRYYETHAALSADGNTIAFVSDRPGGHGGLDIYLMKKLPNGDWADVQNIGATINTEFDEDGPYLHPDGKTIYFSSKGHNSMGGFDVFTSELQDDGSWSTPRNLGYPINTVGEDVFFVPSADGTRAYFSSYREGGEGDQDIYMIDMLDEQKKILVVYKGCIKDLEGEVLTNVLITVFDRETDDIIGEYRANKTSGRFLIVLNPGKYKIEYEYNNLIADENIDVATDEEYHEIGRLVTKSDIKLEIQPIEADCDGLQIVQEQDTTEWKYQLLVDEIPYGGADVEVLSPEQLLVYKEVSDEHGEFRYQPVQPEDAPLFELDLHDPTLCGKAKIILLDGQNHVIKEYTQNIRCKKEVVATNVEPVSMQKFYGYNDKGVEQSEKDFNAFMDAAAKIYEKTGKLTITIEGSASRVPTKTWKSNKVLASKRAEDAEIAIKKALEDRGIALNKVAIDRTSKVNGPAYKGDFESGANKYGEYQYFRATAK